MTTRAVEVGAGIGWLRRALDMGRSNPRAIFGGAALLLVTLFAGAIGLSLLLVLAASALNADPTTSLVVSLIVGLGVVVLMAAMMVGYLRLIHAVEQGRPASAVDVFAGFTDMAASGRAIGFMLLLTIAQYVLIIGLVSVFAHEFGTWYIENLKTSMSGQPTVPMTSLPEGFLTAFVLMAVVGLLSYAVQAIGLGQIANGGSGIAGAFADGVAGAAKNIIPLLVFLLLLLVAGIVLTLVVVLLGAIVGVLAKILGMWLLALIGIPLYLAFLLAMMVVMFGVMYFVWRDICGDVPAADVPRDDIIEV
ncbi:MAG: hypothetical protein EOP93_06140 [Lysobacteraceae bacterium]|nr:MAG: hypothetical protein EOP93_06140 [Xanthomonadaceae bacterium]